MSKLWFKNKRYGYGWVPASIEGWLVIFVYTVLMTLSLCIFINSFDNVFDFFWFLACVFFLTTILLYICMKKGEKPEWRWGDKEKGSH